MKYLFLTFAFVVYNLFLFSQSEEANSDDLFTLVDEMPRFPGCEDVYEKDSCALDRLLDFISTIKYPSKAVKKRYEGRVFLRFVIDEVGNLTQVEVVKTSGHKILDEAAVNHFKTSPKWIPGKQRGRNVKVQYVAPVNFRL